VADPTIAAVPGYAATIAAERWWLGRRRRRGPGPRGWPAGRPPVGYEERDTLTSLAMGGLSLLAPLVAPRLLRPLTPGVGRAGRALVGAAAGLAAVTTVADVVARRAERRRQASVDDHREAAVAERARRVASVGGVGAVATGGVALAAWWGHATEPRRLWDRRLVPDLGSGPLGWAVAMVGWDLIYYWNHRLMHEVRALWAIHVVHHSSQRYNLSTALRQPVADALGVFVPYGALCLVGVRPEVVAGARAWNLLYQYWIHTEVVGDLGPVEEVLNTPSLHRVHHGANRRYLDRNHGGILIVWDRLFGTHEREDPDEPVVYGLTTNVDTHNPARVATHEHVALLADVARARRWRDRLGHVVRRPGWRPAA
jgi:sterol desaturase/sphingolipid hydroxylase (fatty acid hydroxylase superfamily)